MAFQQVHCLPATSPIPASNPELTLLMKKNICFTSFTFSYLAKARVLAWSFKQHNPDWHMIAVITDKNPPGFSFEVEKENFDEVLWSHELGIDDFPSFIFQHDVVEACTAVKGPALVHIMTRHNPEKIMYLDPDIAVYETLEPISSLLDSYEIILTPHNLSPELDERGIIDNEIAPLKHGIYNLGFIAVRCNGEGRKFSEWWRERLLSFCYDDILKGLFTDQRWCDHVPVFFNNVHILKDPGYNVASWNLSNRKVKIDPKGKILVNGSPLRFYHFTKLGPAGEAMTSRYARDNLEVYELWAWYKRVLAEKFVEPSIPENWWYYNTFSNGKRISKEMRVLYRNNKELRQSYPNPFESSGYYRWLHKNR